LRASKPNDEVRVVARVEVLVTLRQLDRERKELLMHYLSEAGLVTSSRNDVIIDLSGADLHGASLVQANLNDADLSGAKLSSAKLDADLRGANLIYADLRGADLRGADLRGVNLNDVDLREADLREADLRGALVTQERLAGVLSLQGATMPNGSTHP
jgi:uncharacterized protein YjbI with pentapeptide repeats